MGYYAPVTTVQYNTNNYAPGFRADRVVNRYDGLIDDVFSGSMPSYLNWWYPRVAQFWKIPRKARNIKFKIPHWYTPNEAWSSTYDSVAQSLCPATEVLSEWIKDPDNIIAVANETASSLGIDPPDPDLVYTLQDTDTLRNSQIASFCAYCNASIQVFHTNGKLLSGTPLRNWDRARGSYYNYGFPGMTPINPISINYSTDITATTAANWHKEGLWTSWYSLVQTTKSGEYYFAYTPVYTANPIYNPPAGTIITPANITAELQALYPSIFDSSFSFDDSSVNGNGLELLKTSNTALKTISVDGETIKWSGNAAGAIGAGSVTRTEELGVWPPYSLHPDTNPIIPVNPVPHNISLGEVLEIDYAQEDLIIGAICSDYFGIVGSWEEYIDDGIRNLPPCPGTLRYHPIHMYQAPYAMTSMSCTDRLHKKTAIHFPIRDEISCIEIRTIGDGTNSGGKRIYTDHSYWCHSSPHPVEVMDMSFGYDYQRLYVLYKQAIDVTDASYLQGLCLAGVTSGLPRQFRSWVTMYDTNLPDGTITDSRVSIPLYGFIQGNEHVHPFIPTNIDSTLSYLLHAGLTGLLIDSPELAPTFNILSAHDKLFVTMPCIFRPISTAWDQEYYYWSPNDARLLCQLLYMFDETYCTFNSVAIIGALSTWLEDWQTPLPQLIPQQPFKLRMSLLDEMVSWMLADVRKSPPDYYYPLSTKQNYPGMFYLNNMYDGTKLPDRFWQPLTLETTVIDDLISNMLKVQETYNKPILITDTKRNYVHNPLTTDMYTKTAYTWEGQRAFGTRDHYLYEDRIVYHNFRRKIITGVGQVEHYTEKSGSKVTTSKSYNPLREWEGSPDFISMAQPVTLEPGHYSIYMRGADGGPVLDGEVGTVLASGGQGATVQVEFDLTKSLDVDVYVGSKGTAWEGGYPNGGNGTGYVVDSTRSVWNTISDINLLQPPGVWRDYQIPRVGYGLFFRVPAGTMNFRANLKFCSAHNASLQVLRAETGELLTGTILGAPGSRNYDLWSYFVWPTALDILPKGTSFVPGKATTGMVTQRIREVYSSYALPPSFLFTDLIANNSSGVQIDYSPTLKSFPVSDDMTIYWTGNSRKGSIVPEKGSQPQTVEELVIDEVTEDLIVAVLSSHWFQLRLDYGLNAEYRSDTPLSSFISGGGGGLTGIFLGTTPLFIAGAGGGGGNTAVLATDPIEANGGHGGTLVGGYGTFKGTNMQVGGSQLSGYQLYKGEDAYLLLSTSGGGGAGYFGGTALQTMSGIQGPGGGGGSSYILGAEGYASASDVFGLTITSYTATPGQTYPWGNAQDGLITITCTREMPVIDRSIDYQFIDHELGDFYYQCATPSKVSESVEYAGLNVILLCDCTSSMDKYVKTLASAVSVLDSEFADANYADIQYAVVGYADNRIYIDTVGSVSTDFTSSVMDAEQRMEDLSDKIRQLKYKTGVLRTPTGMTGSGETWADGFIKSYNQLSPQFVQGRTIYIMITDDINDKDNPSDKTSQVMDICTENEIPVVWVLPESYQTSKITSSVLALRDAVGGEFVKKMSKIDSSWGSDVSKIVASNIPEPVSMERIIGVPHVFSIENLSCHTYMQDVNLLSTNDNIKLAYLPSCNPLLPLGLDMETVPFDSELHWDSIPPHHEVPFIASYVYNLKMQNVTFYRGHSFRLIEDPNITWEDAQAYCVSLGGHLATSTNIGKNSFLTRLSRNKRVWLGATDKETEGVWKWVTGEDWDFTNWAENMPDNAGGDEHYLHLNFGFMGQWNDVSNDQKLAYNEGFICEWDFTELPEPAVSITCDEIKEGIDFTYYLESHPYKPADE